MVEKNEYVQLKFGELPLSDALVWIVFFSDSASWDNDIFRTALTIICKLNSIILFYISIEKEWKATSWSKTGFIHVF
jgi:hypothetical protein